MADYPDHALEAGTGAWCHAAFAQHRNLHFPLLAEVELGNGVIMLGTPPGDYKNPAKLGARTQSVYVYVDDVDVHYKRAKQAGGKIVREPEDQFWGDRNYGVEDPEGHGWYFGTHVRDVSPEEMQTAGATN